MEKYELESCREKAMLLFSDFLLKDVIEVTGNLPCRILIDESFSNRRAENAIKFYNESICITRKRLWMFKYFKEPLQILTKIDNHKLKNRDPIIHCGKIIFDSGIAPLCMWSYLITNSQQSLYII